MCGFRTCAAERIKLVFLGSVADTLGTNGVYSDPMWRVDVRLTDLERDLLRSWWVRRLGFVAHAGAAVIYTTQTYSRLEHL